MTFSKDVSTIPIMMSTIGTAVTLLKKVRVVRHHLMSNFSRPACEHFVELDLHEAWKATGRLAMYPRDLVDNFLLPVGGDYANWRYTSIKRHAPASFGSNLGRRNRRALIRRPIGHPFSISIDFCATMWRELDQHPSSRHSQNFHARIYDAVREP